MAHVLMVGTSMSDLHELAPDPDAITYGLMDVSGSDAGRVEDAGNTMYKMRTSQKRKLSLSWTNPDSAAVSRILQAFNPEYVWLRFFDALEGGWLVREFYVGDRAAPFRSMTLPGGAVFSTLSFDVIER